MRNNPFNPKALKSIKILFFASLLLISPVFGQSIRVAAAANLQAVIKVLAADFKAKTGITVEPIVGSSGNLVSQIKNGAPFDVFLSADMTFPENLFKAGLSTQKPVVYAHGSLIICSTQDIDLNDWEKLLVTDKINKIAIANAKIAPYGKAAEEALKDKAILADVKPKFVTGESISQVNTYITTGVAEVGFTTQALVKDPENTVKLHWRLIDPKSYTPIEQGMVVLKRAVSNKGALRFYQYMLGPGAKVILKEYGYHVQ